MSHYVYHSLQQLKLDELIINDSVYRQHLADFLGTPERANWQVCQTTDEQVKRDVNAFKKAFTT